MWRRNGRLFSCTSRSTWDSGDGPGRRDLQLGCAARREGVEHCPGFLPVLHSTVEQRYSFFVHARPFAYRLGELHLGGLSSASAHVRRARRVRWQRRAGAHPGELSARCDKEAANFLALNLADEIVRKKRSVTDARRMYGEQIMALKAGKPAPYTDRLMFDMMMNTNDPDRAGTMPSSMSTHRTGPDERGAADKQDGGEDDGQEHTRNSRCRDRPDVVAQLPQFRHCGAWASVTMVCVGPPNHILACLT